MGNFLKNKISADIIKNNYQMILLLLLTLSIMLNGCTAMNDNYDCPLKRTASCMSLQEMDANITAEQLRTNSKDKNKINKAMQARQGIGKVLFNNTSKDITLRIWLAPYKDDAGKLHNATYMHAPAFEPIT